MIGRLVCTYVRMDECTYSRAGAPRAVQDGMEGRWGHAHAPHLHAYIPYHPGSFSGLLPVLSCRGAVPTCVGCLLVVGLSCRPVKVAVDGSGARDWYVWRSLVGKEVRGRHIRNIQNCIVSCGMVRQTPAVQTLSPYRPRKVNLPTSQEKSKNRHFFPVSSPKVRRTAAQPGP